MPPALTSQPARSGEHSLAVQAVSATDETPTAEPHLNPPCRRASARIDRCLSNQPPSLDPCSLGTATGHQATASQCHTSTLVLCRHRFLEVQYRRAANNGAKEHTERTVIFLVNAWSLARPDPAAAAVVCAAESAPAREVAAKQAVAAAERLAKEAAEVIRDPSSLDDGPCQCCRCHILLIRHNVCTKCINSSSKSTLRDGRLC